MSLCCLFHECFDVLVYVVLVIILYVSRGSHGYAGGMCVGGPGFRVRWSSAIFPLLVS